jgi:hypothetical protein
MGAEAREEEVPRTVKVMTVRRMALQDWRTGFSDLFPDHAAYSQRGRVARASSRPSRTISRRSRS